MATSPLRPPLDERELQRLEDKARARVTWGDSRDEVQRLLRTKGLDGPAAKRMLDKLFDERKASIRARGLQDLATGGGLAGVCLLAIIGLGMTGRVYVYVIAALGMGLVYGAYLLLRGFGRVQDPSSERGADTIFRS